MPSVESKRNGGVSSEPRTYAQVLASECPVSDEVGLVGCGLTQPNTSTFQTQDVRNVDGMRRVSVGCGVVGSSRGVGSNEGWRVVPHRGIPGRICLWGLSGVPLAEAFAIIDRCLVAGGLSKARVIKRVLQSCDGRTRFDITIAKVRWVKRAVASLRNYSDRAVKRQSGFFTRRSIPYEVRHRGDSESVGLAQKKTRIVSLNIMSWNVNGFKSKSATVEDLSSWHDVHAFCLQETRWVEDEDMEPFVKGFISFSAALEPKTTGRRGVSLLVKRDLVPIHFKTGSPYVVAVELLGRSVLLVNAYVPSRTAAKSEALSCLTDLFHRWSAKRPMGTIILAGDFNFNQDRLAKLCMLPSWHEAGLEVVEEVTGAPTFQSGKRTSKIDHFCTNLQPDQGGFKPKMNVLDTVCESDHFPILLEGVRVECQKKISRGDNSHLRKSFLPLASVPQEKIGEFLNDELLGLDTNAAKVFNIDLANISELDGEKEEFLDGEVNNFLTQIDAAATKAGLAVTSKQCENGEPKRNPHVRPSRRTRKLLVKRRKISNRRLKRSKRNTETLKVLARKIRVSTSKDRRMAKQSAIERASCLLQEGDIKGFYGWLKSYKVSRVQRKQHPLRAGDGSVISEAKQLAQMWGLHFSKLAEQHPELGNKDEKFWEQRLSGETRQNLGIDGEVTKTELCQVLGKMKSNKAPGESAIPVDIFKLSTCEEGELLAERTLAIINTMLKFAYIPDQLRSAVVREVEKSGDLLDPNNYRGISLTESLLKIITSIIHHRIQNALEASDFFHKTQGGFRATEECCYQYITLLEIAQRRLLEKKDTFIAFLDFKKAYDSVIHESLFRKMQMAGIQGQIKQFIKNLYRSSTFYYRNLAGKSETHKLLRGVRQGCPLSPTLYNVFVNDILKQIENPVEVPHLGDVTIPGLQFADDTTLVASTLRDLRKSLKRVGKWAARHGAAFNIQKSAVLVVQSCNDGASKRKLVKNPPKLQGESLPVVSKYKYLGLEFNDNLSLESIVATRAEKVRRARGMITRLLLDREVPLKYKLVMITSTLMPVATFGGEVLGLRRKELVDPIQLEITKAVRLAVTGNKGKVCDAKILLKECGISPVWVKMSAARVRVFVKSHSSKTYIKELVQNTGKYGRKTWASGTRCFLSKLARSESEVFKGLEDYKKPSSVEDQAKLAKKYRDAVVPSLESKFFGKSSSKGGVRYENLNFNKSAHFISDGKRYWKWAAGVQELVKMRVDAYWFSHQADIVRNQINGGKSNKSSVKCQFCTTTLKKEDTAHFLLRCKHFKKQRREYLSDIVKHSKNTLSKSYNDEDIANILLGGTPVGGLKDHKDEVLKDNGTPNISFNLGKVFSPYFGQARYLPVVKFLQTCAPIRRKCLWGDRDLTKSPGVEARNTGMAGLMSS